MIGVKFASFATNDRQIKRERVYGVGHSRSMAIGERQSVGNENPHRQLECHRLVGTHKPAGSKVGQLSNLKCELCVYTASHLCLKKGCKSVTLGQLLGAM